MISSSNNNNVLHESEARIASMKNEWVRADSEGRKKDLFKAPSMFCPWCGEPNTFTVNSISNRVHALRVENKEGRLLRLDKAAEDNEVEAYVRSCKKCFSEIHTRIRFIIPSVTVTEED